MNSLNSFDPYGYKDLPNYQRNLAEFCQSKEIVPVNPGADQEFKLDLIGRSTLQNNMPIEVWIAISEQFSAVKDICAFAGVNKLCNKATKWVWCIVVDEVYERPGLPRINEPFEGSSWTIRAVGQTFNYARSLFAGARWQSMFENLEMTDYMFANNLIYIRRYDRDLRNIKEFDNDDYKVVGSGEQLSLFDALKLDESSESMKEIYTHHYEICKPFANEYPDCGKDAFHNQNGQKSTPKQKAEAIWRSYQFSFTSVAKYYAESGHPQASIIVANPKGFVLGTIRLRAEKPEARKVLPEVQEVLVHGTDEFLTDINGLTLILKGASEASMPR